MTDDDQPYEPYWQPGPGVPPPPSRPPGITISLGERGHRRPEPRLGPALAGAGIGLAIFGVLLWSFTYLIQGALESFNSNSGGVGDVESRRWLGVGLSVLVVAVGYTLAARFRRGPLATAGVAASAVGIPVALAFVSLSLTSDSLISFDAVVLVSLLAWLISYFLVPGTKGHTVYLGLAAVSLWAYLLDKADPDSVSGLVVRTAEDRFGSGGGFGGSSSPEPATIAALSLIFGLGYYTIALVLDRKARSGPAVAFVLAGAVATTVGVAAAAADFKQIGTGVLLIVLGLLIATFAARAGRRFTTWYWSAAVALGLGLVILKLVGNDQTALAGAMLIIGGFVLVGAGYAMANALKEPDEFPPDTWVIPATYPPPPPGPAPGPGPYPGPYPPAY